MKPLAIYLHIPFCVKKCSYCDFLSFSAGDETRVRYVEVLQREIKEAAAALPKQTDTDYQVQTIYFGGGTPSLLEEKEIRKLIHTVKDYLCVDEEAETTLEVNPGTVSSDKLTGYFDCGVNRLSIGAQSLQNQELQLLGRIHTADDFYQTFRDARTAGFRNISVDIMEALPGQTLQVYLDTLRQITLMRPEHISSYSLIIEEGTPFYEIFCAHPVKNPVNEQVRRRYPIPSDEEERRMYHETYHFLKSNGYHRYEISNFAREEGGDLHRFESRHNTVYWKRGDYLGLGLGASSMIRNVRFSNTRNFKAYLEGEGNPEKIRENQQKLSLQAQVEEFMFLGLRMCDGIRIAEFEKEFGIPMESVYGKVIRDLEDQGLLQQEEGYLFLTSLGIDVSNRVMACFLLDE